MLTNFFNANLRNAETRIAPVRQSSRFHLDKNEQSEDLDPVLKQKVMESLMQVNWNRYPAAEHKDIEAKVAEYCHLDPQNVVLSAGSASIITTLLDYFALNRKKIIINQPSYSLFDYHCKTYNIPYTPWMLTPELGFDLGSLPPMGPDSVLIITSPNNPTGNAMGAAQLERLLRANPESLIVLDGVYCEFGDEDVTHLVRKYDNLIVLRSFSKAFPIAGLRLGYLCAAPHTAEVVRKLILQFSINHFTLVFAREMLFSEEFMANSRARVKGILRERERMAEAMQEAFSGYTLKVFPSQGNFLLVRIHDDFQFEQLLSDLAENGIKVLNTSGFPLLKNTFRVSIGNAAENDVFLKCMKQSLRMNKGERVRMAV